MLDFVSIKTASLKKGTVSIYPEFLIKKSKDLMIRGKSFYAVWDEELGLWSKSEDDIQRMVDKMTKDFADNYITDDKKSLKLLSNFSSNKWTEWQKYCKSLPDNFHELDEKVIFSNSKVKKTDYASRRLPYPIAKSDIPAYEELIGTLYEPSERQKLEWAIGSIISGDSKNIQKFVVLYGGPGTGKSTALNIIQQLFPGYYSMFESKALASANNVFALEAFKNNPLIAIQHDGDLSRIEDNTKLNSIVSHEIMVVNEKFKSMYSSRFNSFIFMGTNKPVKITDAKSGIIRRLIDISPSGNRIPRKRFEELYSQITFELSGIANHCLQVYLDLGFTYYDDYIPMSMLGATNDFFNFIEDNYDFFAIENPEYVTLNSAWLRYKEYCLDANLSYPYNRRVFKEELKNYFKEYHDRQRHERSVYVGFRTDKLEYKPLSVSDSKDKGWLMFNETESLFDDEYRDCQAQYENESGVPNYKWSTVRTTLKDLDTSRVHYVRTPPNLIVIDFDIKDENGNKDYIRNLREASKWPKTYAELSKSGAGIHLHYIYEGDVSKLRRIYKDDVEIKVFTGKSSLRRKLTKCNDIPISKIKSGLPLKEESKKMITDAVIKSEKGLRDLINRNLRKEIHGATKPSIDFIYKILEDAYEQGLKYDVSDMAPKIQVFANNSTHNALYCLKLVSKMKFKSEDVNLSVDLEEKPIIFFDVEVFPNLFIVVWKNQGSNNKPVKMVNPKPSDIDDLIKFRLVGFNNRRYDNHILYARMMGYTEEQLYNLSQRIISGDNNAFFGEAYNLSYTDIYDFLSAAHKMSLKKWEIKLGIHHQELGLPWDKPVDKNLWDEVAEYCTNDVVATEAVWNANQGDWLARKILADIAGMSVNDTTNQLTTKIIVGDDKNPQKNYIYTDLSTIYPGYRYDNRGIDKSEYNEGAKIISATSIYKGEDPGEGGRVYATPGMYSNVALLDVASMHPHSAIALNIFGKYTKNFEELVDARVAIKHGNYEEAKTYLNGKLSKWLEDKSMAKALADALKTAINSVYGLTSAKFSNKLKDPRNKDNIVAKYGSLFMINLQYEVQKRGYIVAHIKTDSIKIPNASKEIINFVMDYGKQYGFTFEHEATYDKMCIVNDAVYIAKVGEVDGKRLNNPYWTATGTQFQVPYVFKSLFSKEPILFEDLCETKSVSTALYLDMNENLPDGEHDYHFVGKVGSFCPVVPGSGGGVLLRQSSDGKKFSAVAGTKKPWKVKPGEPETFLWLEAEMVKSLNKEDCVDHSYYIHMVDEAVETISKFGDFEMFVSDMEFYDIDPSIKTDSIPFEKLYS